MHPRDSIKIVFFGTSEFALPALRALIQKKWHIVAVITKPDEPAGRKLLMTPPPVKELALQAGVPIFQPEVLEPDFFKKEVPEADLFIVAAYGKIIPQQVMALPKLGAINIHPSLLPRWRGPSPIQAAIFYGDQETGVTLIKLDELMDHGPLIAQEKVSIKETSSYSELADALAQLAADMLTRILPDWVHGKISAIPQNDELASFCKLLKKDDGRVNWSRSAKDIERMIRAYHPWPGAWTLWPSGQKIYRIKIESAICVADESPFEGMPGNIWQSKSHPLLVKTKQGSVALKKIIIEGKKALNAKELTHGYPEIIGATFV